MTAYEEYRRKRLLWEMKTCKAWLRKVQIGMIELGCCEYDKRNACLDNARRTLKDLIKEMEERK